MADTQRLNLFASEQLAYSTVRIEAAGADGSVSTGTGFFFRCLDDGKKYLPVLVTNKHVVAGAQEGRFHLTARAPDGGPQPATHTRIVVGHFQDHWAFHPDPEVDLAVMPIAPLVLQAKQDGKEFFFIELHKKLLPTPDEIENLSALEDIVMVGYPNGIWDTVNNMPIFRRGITASHPNLNYDGKGEFMIDAACFPGSSGSPVFLYNVGGWQNRDGTMVMGGTRVRLLGVLYAGPQHTAKGEIRIVNVPTQQTAIALSTIPNNLGVVIKAARLLEFDAVIEQRIKPG